MAKLNLLTLTQRLSCAYQFLKTNYISIHLKTCISSKDKINQGIITHLIIVRIIIFGNVILVKLMFFKKKSILIGGRYQWT